VTLPLSYSRLTQMTPCLRVDLRKAMELTERLELSTSPLPRECSTTELRQPLQHNSSILPRTQPSEHDAEGKKAE
jgi:hypothetical protein